MFLEVVTQTRLGLLVVVVVVVGGQDRILSFFCETQVVSVVYCFLRLSKPAFGWCICNFLEFELAGGRGWWWW